MTTQTIDHARHSISERAESMQDVLLVSSFGLWAAILGLMPVLAWRLMVS